MNVVADLSLQNADIQTETVVPPSWRLLPLGEFCKTTSGGTPSRDRPEYYSGNVAWVKSGELQDGRIYGTEETITELGLRNSSAKLFPAGTLLVAMYGATAGQVGILEVDAATNQAVCAILPSSEAITIYLFFAILYRRNALLAERYGGAQPNISQTILRSFKITLPPLPEQRAIATTLSAAQEARDARRREAQLQRERKAALMQRLFSEGTRGELRRATEIGELPESWRVVRLGEAVRQTQYGLSVRGEQSGPYPILRMNNLYDSKIHARDLQFVTLDARTLEQYKLNKGELLFNRTNSYEHVGKTGLFDLEGDYVFASYLVRVVPDPTKADASFLNEYLNWTPTQQRLKMMATRGVSQSNINATKLVSLLIPVPDIVEQREIAETLRACDEVIAVLEREAALLDELFRGLLEELMTGRIRVIDGQV